MKILILLGIYVLSAIGYYIVQRYLEKHPTKLDVIAIFIPGLNTMILIAAIMFYMFKWISLKYEKIDEYKFFKIKRP